MFYFCDVGPYHDRSRFAPAWTAEAGVDTPLYSLVK